jgi:hypothetical protein
MNTSKKRYRKTKDEDFDNLKYSAEESELLGIPFKNLDTENEDTEDNNEDIDDDEIVSEDSVDDFVEHKIDYDKKPKNKKKADKEKFYVDPKEFDSKILEYYETGVLSNELAEMVSKIAHKLSYASNFINYSFRDDMIGDGIIRMLKALMSKKYNHSKGTNPFSYFTRIAFNAFRNRIKKEKHMYETHEKYQNEFLMFSEGYNNMIKKNNKNIQKYE